MPVTGDGKVIEGAGSWPMPVGGEPPPADEYDDEPAAPENATDRVMALLGDVTGDDKAIVKVYRKRPDGKNAWLDEYSPAEFETGGIKMMREKYGVGSYVIFLYGITHRGAFGIRTKAEIEIEASKDFDEARRAPPANDARMDRLEAALLKMAERPAVDPMVEMQKMLMMVSTMREAFGLNAPPAVQKSGVSEALDMMREMRAAASELMPEREPSDEGGLMGMVKTVMPLIGNVIAHQQANASAALPALPPIDNGDPIASDNQPVPAYPPTVATPEGDKGEPPMSAEMLAMLAIKGYIRAIALMAKTGVDPQKGADMIYKHLPDEMIGMMELPVWWELLVEQAPELKPHQEWVTKARDLAMAQFAKEASELDDRGDDVPGSQAAT